MTGRQSATDVQLVDVTSAANMLGLSTWTIRELVASGELPVVRPPAALNRTRAMRRLLFDRRDLVAAIDRWKSGGAR
jgi:hypothetical protein